MIKLRNRGAMSFHEIKTEHFRVLCSVLFLREDKVKVSLKGGMEGDDVSKSFFFVLVTIIVKFLSPSKKAS